MSETAEEIKNQEDKKNTSKAQGEMHHFDAEVAKILHLMIHSLYTNKDIFLRELISNASDACDKLRHEAQKNAGLLKDDSELKVRVSFDKQAKTLTITDNGIGMNKEDLISQLGTIARSGTQEFIKQLDAAKEQGTDVSLIGQFGVGFYSAFIVADKVSVISTKAGEETSWLWESEGQGQFSVTELDEPHPRGTTITLHLRPEEDSYLDKWKLQHIIKTYSDHIAFPIEVTDEEGNTTVANSASALWVRSKSEISEEQYKEFYHHVAHQPDEPWLTLHYKAEGKIEYTSLLFIPSTKPFDLFHPDRMRRVKLYVKRVFITDEGVDIIPHYLRFMRGVVDSEDLPLNISRETLQHNVILERIKSSIVKKVLGELKKKATKDPESYARFWENFGACMKEGLCESLQEREPLLEVCRFFSSSSEGKLVSLDEYLERMKEGQEHIYYLTGDNLEALRHSPQLEGFRSRGIEVLLLTDHVDDFWVNVVNEFKGRPFKSVTRAGDDLEQIKSDKEEEKKDKEETSEAKKADVDNLISLFKATLGEAVKDVRISHKLTESPVCLAVEEGGMDIRLERFLVEQKQLQAGTAKILEINPDHPIITQLAERASKKGASEDLQEMAFLLLDQAKIIEGEEVADPGAFSKRLTEVLAKSLSSA